MTARGCLPRGDVCSGGCEEGCTSSACCKNYANVANVANVNVKLLFIPALALLGMRSTYIGQLVQAAAAPLILRMRACIGGVAYT